MVKLVSGFEFPFERDVQKPHIKIALKNELLDSFAIKEEPNTTAMIEYLIDVFFWEFFHHFSDELKVQFANNPNKYCGGET